ncbi:MAG: glycosyltransferase family 2 protein [Nanoarchaeota archaeon]|nr:glycosyltransferase family 2 protein [Nanoarchaeota archaeon]MBU0976844.1 glycosyltransferase family 2 protein [Nanoarchaeota archaeon]
MSKSKKPDISVFFPVYNEEGNITKLANDAQEILSKVANNYEVLFVLLESSTDNSEKIIKDLNKQDKRIKLVLQPANFKGVGQAYKQGYEAAKYPIIFYADGDNQFDLREIKNLLGHIPEYDIVAGYRINRQDPWIRRLTSKTYNTIVRILFGRTVKDVDCAFRMVKKDVFKKVKLTRRYGTGTAELLIKAKMNGFKIKEVGVKHLPRYAGQSVFESRMNLPKVSVVTSVLKDLFDLRKELRNESKKA